MGRSKRNRKGSAEYNIIAQIKREEKAKKRQEKNDKRRNAKRQIIMEERYLVGFYGDYKKGTREHIEITKHGSSTKFIGFYDTEPEFSLYELNNTLESALLKNGNNSVLMEVYEINKTTLDNLDMVLGYDSHLPDICYYVREKINSPFGDIYVYIWNDKIKQDDTLIRDGDWLDYKQNQRKKCIMSIKPSDNSGKGTALVEIDDQERIDKEFMD